MGGLLKARNTEATYGGKKIGSGKRITTFHRSMVHAWEDMCQGHQWKCVISGQLVMMCLVVGPSPSGAGKFLIANIVVAGLMEVPDC